ncbi:MAG: GNAT family N-acetyltransferase [Anaerolineae bacterium]|nr:GNAT family N-acetyltransferase [Anaerolineae bacterium]
MNVKVREADESDFESLCTLFAEENRFHASLVPEYIKTTPQVLTQEELRDFLTSNTKRLFICENESALLGAIIVSLKDESENRWNQSRRTGYIDDLIVTKTARGRGVGRQLMEIARDWVLSQGVQVIELHVWEANVVACRFYESLGLKSIQRRMVWKL